MTLADFQTLFDLLESPIHILHYLKRREETEASISFLGDELDLLGWYLDSLFNLPKFNAQFSQIIISGLSDPLDQYYILKDQGITSDKPKPKVISFFQGVLRQLENRDTYRWSEVGTLLFGFSPDDQRKLTRHLKVLHSRVEKNWRIHGH